MNRDTYRQILLQADLDDISTLCLIDKSFQQICNDHGFWIEKYQQMGVSVVEKQASIASYIDDLKNCLAILPTIDPILQKLLLERYEDGDHEILILKSLLNNIRPLRIPSIDPQIVQKMLNAGKREHFQNEAVIQQETLFLNQVNLDNHWLKLFNWGIKASLFADTNQRKFYLSLEVPWTRYEKTFDITADVRSYIYLLSYYGIVSQFELEEFPQ